jgi:hypothetical protein
MPSGNVGDSSHVHEQIDGGICCGMQASARLSAVRHVLIEITARVAAGCASWCLVHTQRKANDLAHRRLHASHHLSMPLQESDACGSKRLNCRAYDADRRFSRVTHYNCTVAALKLL